MQVRAKMMDQVNRLLWPEGREEKEAAAPRPR